MCAKERSDTLLIQTSDRDIIYQIELALTPEQQKIGLMYRENLPPQTGMLFIFKNPRIAHMWMKNTLIPLDMIFFDTTGRVIHIHENAHPLDTTVISSYQPVAGVLEINAGEAKAFNITTGSTLDLKNIQKQ